MKTYFWLLFLPLLMAPPLAWSKINCAKILSKGNSLAAETSSQTSSNERASILEEYGVADSASWRDLLDLNERLVKDKQDLTDEFGRVIVKFLPARDRDPQLWVQLQDFAGNLSETPIGSIRYLKRRTPDTSKRSLTVAGSHARETHLRPWHEGVHFRRSEEALEKLKIVKIQTMARYLKDLGRSYSGSSSVEMYVIELENGVRAVFRPDGKDPEKAAFEVSGYRYCRMLGTRFAPTTIIRTIDRVGGERVSAVDSWKWDRGGKTGSLQLMVDAANMIYDPDKREQIYNSLPPEKQSDIGVVLATFGQYDNHFGNIAFDETNEPILYDFEVAKLRQKLRYGEFPWVENSRPIRNDVRFKKENLPPFPFDSVVRMTNPTIDDLKAKFPDGIERPALQKLYEKAQGQRNGTIEFITWDNHLWFSGYASSRRSVKFKAFSSEMIAALKRITQAALREAFPSLVKDKIIEGQLERIGVIIETAGERAPSSDAAQSTLSKVR